MSEVPPGYEPRRKAASSWLSPALSIEQMFPFVNHVPKIFADWQENLLTLMDKFPIIYNVVLYI